MPVAASTRIVPALPTDFASTVTPPAAALPGALDAAWVAAGTDAAAKVGAVVVVDPEHAAAAMTTSAPLISVRIPRAILGTPCDRSSGRDHISLYARRL